MNMMCFRIPDPDIRPGSCVASPRNGTARGFDIAAGVEVPRPLHTNHHPEDRPLFLDGLFRGDLDAAELTIQREVMQPHPATRRHNPLRWLWGEVRQTWVQLMDQLMDQLQFGRWTYKYRSRRVHF